jgi:hypothetical protein
MTEYRQVPVGAIENGREFIRRLEEHYTFECDGGPLRLCVEWDELKRCFEHLAQYAAAPKPDGERVCEWAMVSGGGTISYWVTGCRNKRWDSFQPIGPYCSSCGGKVRIKESGDENLG